MKLSWLFFAGLFLATACAVVALSADPKQELSSYPPDEATLRTIEQRLKDLDEKLKELRKANVKDPYLAEVEIFHKAAAWAVKHNEFPKKESAQWTLDVLDRGLLRASQQARGESPWLFQAGYSIPRAYRSQVDGSVQPFAVTFPTEYGKGQPRRWRLDVVLHGRSDKMNEVEFLKKHSTGLAAPRDLDYVMLDIYGRGNNAYRWAGESDYMETIDSFLAVETILGRGLLHDPDRTVLRGFSMGGAGTWHLGLHKPDKWCVLGPGAGFTTTHGYAPTVPAKLPPYQEACLTIYDAVNYAENAGMVSVVAYAGSEDPQLQAAKNIQDRLKGLDIKMTLLVGKTLDNGVEKGLGHVFPPEWQKKAEEEYARYLKQGRINPIKVHFVTHTLKYPSCDWVEIFALDRHYDRAVVDAEQKADGFEVKTTNVRGLKLRLWKLAERKKMTTVIDGQTIETVPYYDLASEYLFVYLEKRDGKWKVTVPEKVLTERLRQPQKWGGQQGPIDDAFMRSFVCVRGTGKPWHAGTQSYAEANLKRFGEEWSKYLRGELPVKNDTDVGPEQFAANNLILFGDPGSNSIIEMAMSGLPFKWERDKITWNGKEYASSEHVPVMIFPSPFNPEKYIVLNSGHTFHAKDFIGTNALLYPRLGDYALLKCTGGKENPLAEEVIEEATGLFDDFWHIPPVPDKKNQDQGKR
jgi:pimeloyl-ACP methyl ester carboxylesterase